MRSEPRAYTPLAQTFARMMYHRVYNPRSFLSPMNPYNALSFTSLGIVNYARVAKSTSSARARKRNEWERERERQAWLVRNLDEFSCWNRRDYGCQSLHCRLLRRQRFRILRKLIIFFSTAICWNLMGPQKSINSEDFDEFINEIRGRNSSWFQFVL